MGRQEGLVGLYCQHGLQGMDRHSHLYFLNDRIMSCFVNDSRVSCPGWEPSAVLAVAESWVFYRGKGCLQETKLNQTLALFLTNQHSPALQRMWLIRS